MPGEGRHLTIGEFHHILGSGGLVWSSPIRLRLRSPHVSGCSTLQVQEHHETFDTVDRRMGKDHASESFIALSGY